MALLDRLVHHKVRPLVLKQTMPLDQIDSFVEDEIRSLKMFFHDSSKLNHHIYGDTIVYSDMTDWNPAEIIGVRPKPLASSLYTHVIMRGAWREARAKVGYFHPFPQHLLINLAGHPYVDVRSCFNSFLPSSLSDHLSHKLINYYLKRLHENPEFHDKAEFEIVISSLSFDFDVHAVKLKENGFTNGEIQELRESLFYLTDHLVNDRYQLLCETEQKLEQLSERRKELLKREISIASVPAFVDELLQDCISYGTVPFSIFVRGAFIGAAFLKGLQKRQIVTTSEYESFLNSIATVTTDFVRDLADTNNGILSREMFLERYGHLRPGTYDITIPSYAEDPDRYISFGLGKVEPQSHLVKDFRLSTETMEKIAQEIELHGFTFDADKLLEFIRYSYVMRELSKFEFSKNLSIALTRMKDFGHYYGMSEEELSYLSINDFIRFSHHNFSISELTYMKSVIRENKKRYHYTSAVCLPDLILLENDLEIVECQMRKPNFVTQQKIEASILCMDQLSQQVCDEDFEDKIIFIENADPGYDWLFSKSIAGLVTKYGGAASHMTIRCAELGLPAAIGCGEFLYEQLKEAEVICLDCMGRQIRKLY